MDKEQLAKDYPELLAQIKAEARAEAQEAAAKESKAVIAASEENILTIVGMVAGGEAATYVHRIVAAGITAEQMRLIAPMMQATATGSGATYPDSAKPEKPQIGDGKAEVLAALRSATPAPVDTSVAPQGVDPLQATIDQISSVEL